MNASSSPLDSKTPLLDYYEGTFRKLRLKGRSEMSDKQYRIQLRHLDRFLGRAATLADLDDDTIIAFLVGRHEATTPATANKARNHILALWRFAARKGHVRWFPDVARLQEPKRIPQAWSHAQLARLVETAYRAEMPDEKNYLHIPTTGIPPNLWWTGLILFLYETGVRIGAALQLRTADIDLESGRVIVRAEIQKQYADQVFTITEETRSVLRQFAGIERELLFPWARTTSSFYLHWKKLLAAAGLPTGRRCGPHRIRRTTATFAELHLGRGTATGILGHSSAHVTRAYIDTSMLPENRFAENLPRPMLIGQTSLDGTMPSAAEMLPKPAPAVVPIEHSVSAVILPKSIEAESHPLLEADMLAVVTEYGEHRRTKLLSQTYRKRCLRFLCRIAAELRLAKLRDFDGSAVSKWLQREAAAGRIGRATHEVYRAAVGKFLDWIICEKGVYVLLRQAGPFVGRFPHQHREGAKTRKGGAA